MIEIHHPEISVRRQCELIGLNRSTWNYVAKPVDAYTLLLMRLIDEEYTRHPFLGRRRMTAYLDSIDHHVNEKRVRRLYGLLGLEAVYPKPRTTVPNPAHQIYP